MSKANTTDVKWRIPNDLYGRLKQEAAKEVNMSVSTFALSFLNRHFPPQRVISPTKPYPTSNEVLYRGEPK